MTRNASTAAVLAQVAALVRYPVKSMAGERLAHAEFVERGVVGDRAWAAYTADGGIGSGKNTGRFRRINGLLGLRAHLCDEADEVDGASVPWVTFPDGQELRADDPRASEELSALLGQPLQLRPETTVPHHDESPIHLVTSASTRHLEQLHGEPVQAARFRANVVFDVDGAGFVDDTWQGRELALGDHVVLRLGPAMPRCLMVDLAQPHDGLPPESRLLKSLGRTHRAEFGQQATVVRAGAVRVGDPVEFL